MSLPTKQDGIPTDIHNLLRRVKNARLSAMLENDLELSMTVAGDILDEVERELERIEEL